MGDKSLIEWTDATWNPTTGCTKVSAGCKNCYAERVFPRAYGTERKFTDVVCHEDRLGQPLHWKRPRKIFVNSMSDLFHEDIPESFILATFMNMSRAHWHTFQVLTKRAGRMQTIMTRWFIDGMTWREGGTGIPNNVWLGVSVEDQKAADARIPVLLNTPAAVRFVSYEPALGPVDFINFLWATPENEIVKQDGKQPRLDWIIGGTESGPKARDYETEWFANVARQCEQAGVAFFMKQLTERGRKIPFEQWPGYLQVRQYPKAAQ